jgi:NADH:ubiquinone oxidoreductase subunit C
MDINAKIRERLNTKIKDWQEHSSRRIYFKIDKQDIRTTASILFKELGFRLSTATAMDNPDGFEILYHFSDDKAGKIFSMRTFIKGRENAEIDSLVPVFKAAEWIEREIWELFGINFKGHPDLRHLLLADDWPKDEFPMRKDYKKPHERQP